MGAIGNNYFVETLNGAFSIYNRTTGALAAPMTSLTQFWQNAGITGLNNNPSSGTSTADPRIIYDPVSQHWFASTIDTPATGANRVLLAASNTSDPTAGFHAVAYQSNTTGLFGDYDTLGMNQNVIAIGLNNFSGNTFNSTGFVTIQKSDLIAGSTASLTRVEGVNVNNTGFTSHPVIDFNGTGSLDSLSAYNLSNVKLTTVSNTGSSTTVNTSVALMGIVQASTVGAVQQGTAVTIDASDTRFSGALFEQVVGGVKQLYAVHTVGGLNGRDALQWMVIDPATNTILNSGLIQDGVNDYYYGSIAVNPNGDAVIGFTRSGPNEYASAYAAVGNTITGLLTFGNPFLLQAGAGTYNLTYGGSRNRWGDYSSTTLDPTNPYAFWTVQEFTYATNVWGTQITEIVVGEVPEPGTLSMAGIAFALLGAGALGLRKRRV